MLWISGDTVLYDGVREVADRLEVDTALLHLGGVRFGVSGPLRYTMTARDAVELCGLVRPRTAIPIHYEGWKHFKQGREAIEAELATAPQDIAPALSLAADRGGGRPGGVSRARAGGYGARVRRLFVTGLGGHLGSELGRRAPAAGWEVAGIMGSAEADVRDGPAVLAAVEAARPDVVVHTAYRLDDPSVNVEGTRAVAAAAVAAGARLVHISSDVVFAGTGTRALTEDDEPGPVTPYGVSKLEAEGLCPPDALIVRTSLIYGGRGARRRRSGWPSTSPTACATWPSSPTSCAARSPWPTSPPRCSSSRSSTTVGPLHVAGADVLSRLDFARLVCRHHGRDPTALRGAPAGPDRPKHLVLDCSRARALLRVRLRGAREVLAT